MRLPMHPACASKSTVVAAGAPEEILTEAHPHIGTFRLVTMVEAMREKIEKLGGEYRFEHRVTDIDLDKGVLRGVRLHTGETVMALMFEMNHESGTTLVLVTHDRGIAARFGVTVDAIMKANGITNANLIKIGQILKLP